MRAHHRIIQKRASFVKVPEKRQKRPIADKKCCNCGCGRDQTTMWRTKNGSNSKGSNEDSGALCNACGIYLKEKGHSRPETLWRTKKKPASPMSTAPLIHARALPLQHDPNASASTKLKISSLVTSGEPPIPTRPSRPTPIWTQAAKEDLVRRSPTAEKANGAEVHRKAEEQVVEAANLLMDLRHSRSPSEGPIPRPVLGYRPACLFNPPPAKPRLVLPPGIKPLSYPYPISPATSPVLGGQASAVSRSPSPFAGQMITPETPHSMLSDDLRWQGRVDWRD